MTETKVIVDDIEYILDRRYDLELTFAKVSDWRLWRIDDVTHTLIGGQFDSKYFALYIDGKCVLEQVND